MNVLKVLSQRIHFGDQFHVIVISCKTPFTYNPIFHSCHFDTIHLLMTCSDSARFSSVAVVKK
jgi:hypothetical protein